MNLTITNQTCEDIVFNGHYLEKLYFNEHLVWEKQHSPVNPYATEYFTTTSLVNNNTIVLVVPNGLTSSNLEYIEWSKDKTSWNRTVIDSTEQAIEIVANANENIYWRGVGSCMATSGSLYSYFKGEYSFDVSGNIMSLLYGSNFVGQTTLSNAYCFAKLFSPPPAVLSHNTVVNADNLVLPATTAQAWCYVGMFYGCTSLVTAPELPATTLANGCYSNMFYGCTSLTTAPELPATTLAKYCYNSMFNGCTSLTTAPDLLATTLANYCYFEMFQGCTSLNTAPDLLATSLADSCCAHMFQGCTSLTTTPVLLATTLATSCYFEMFRECTSLNKVTCLATDISAGSCITNWLYHVSSTGTFIKDSSMSSWPSGTGIPSGWTVQNYS